MSITGTISFRSLLVGRIEGFVGSTDFSPLVTEQSLTELVSAASNYTEEGQSLSPAVYATSDITKLLQFIPGSLHIKIGKLAEAEGALITALKKCAPLATEGWCIYVCIKENKVTYGLFSDSQFPLNIPIEEALLGIAGNDLKIVKVQQSAPSCVELANHIGDKHTIFLSDKKESADSPGIFISELSKIICHKLSESNRPPIQTLLEKALIDGLTASHGALIAVTTAKALPTFLNDGQILNEPIDFAHLIDEAKRKTMEDNLRLAAFVKVLRGMFNCDGIIVFSPHAKLLGYNCFVKSNNNNAITGGARKRAFATLESKIDNGLSAAFIRSHDGWSQLTKSEKI